MAHAAPVTRVHSERFFFTGIAIAMTAFVFLGFAPTYFLYPVIGVEAVRGAAPLTPLVHFHAAIGSAWMLFLILQTSLIMGRQYEWHMRSGIVGAGLALAIVVVGIAVAIWSARVGRTPPGWTATGFLIIPFATVVLFGGFIAAGVACRRRSDYHKRLMLLGTIAMLVPAGSRFARYYLDGIVPPGTVGGMILSDAFLAALVAYDLGARARLHPVTLWGGGFLLASQPLRMMLSRSEGWNAFAAWIIG